MMTPTLERTETPEELIQAAHRKAYSLGEKELAIYLKGVLGRPLIAYITNTADPNSVTRWSTGKANPDRGTWEQLRTLATIHIALTAILESETSAAQWFTGANPFLDFQMPSEELRKGNVTVVYAAVRNLAEV